jgi:hypothetical protein
MRRLYNIKILMVLSLLIITTNVFAQERNTKYQEIFYPNGMPVKSDSALGVTGPTEYQLYSELAVPNTDIIIVVFSEKIIGDPEALSFKYSVFISVLQPVNGVLNIKYLKEITDSLVLTSLDDPGYFYDMESVLNLFDISKDVKGVDLCINNHLAGSGGISSASDIFFLIKDYQLVPVLKLLNDDNGGRAGGSYLAFTYNFIYIADTDADGTTEIITQEYNYENDRGRDIFISQLSPNLNVYKYDSTAQEYILSRQINSLPSNAVKLRRLYEPDVDKLTKEGCCP